MATIKIGSGAETFEANKAGTLYAMAAGETIAASDFGIEATGAPRGREIRVDGDVSAALAAVRLGINGQASAAVAFTLGQDGALTSANTGLIAYGSGHVIRIAGEISGGTSGILAYGPQTISNTGTIEGGAGVDFVGIDGRGEFLRNAGTIDGISTAFRGGEFADRVINTGQMLGDVLLGAGDDSFVLKDGDVAGKVRGGFGNDSYVLAKTGLQILEVAGQGWDTIRTYVDLALADNTEVLRLMGKGDLLGVGNGGANHLFGNSGNNTLYGGFGDDVLHGGRGDDILSGATDADEFHFARKSGVDTILDFQPGMDEIHFDGVKGATDFAAMMAQHVTQVDGDVWITYGADTVIIKDTMRSALQGGDFVFG